MNNKITTTLKNASNDKCYLINGKYKIRFIKSGSLFNEYRHMKMCPTWEAFEYAMLLDKNKSVKIYMYDHTDMNYSNATLCFEEYGKTTQMNNITSIENC